MYADNYSKYQAGPHGNESYYTFIDEDINRLQRACYSVISDETPRTTIYFTFERERTEILYISRSLRRFFIRNFDDNSVKYTIHALVIFSDTAGYYVEQAVSIMKPLHVVERGLTDEEVQLKREKTVFEGLRRQLEAKPPSAQLDIYRLLSETIRSALSAGEFAQDWVARVGKEKPTADVELPERAPELWNPIGDFDPENISREDRRKLPPEHREVLSGRGRDDALIAFTKRVYGSWFKDYESAMGVSEINPLDTDLYEELKGVRNRMNGRKEKFPFPTVKDRNKVLIERIHAGEIEPPRNYRAFVNLNNVAKRQGRSIAR